VAAMAFLCIHDMVNAVTCKYNTTRRPNHMDSSNKNKFTQLCMIVKVLGAPRWIMNVDRTLMIRLELMHPI